MNTNQPTTLDKDHAKSPIRALHSLRELQVDSIVAGLAELGAEWAIERHESCDGYLSLVVQHRFSEVAIVADQDQAGMRVGLLLGDELQSGTQAYTNSRDVVQAILSVAERLTSASHRQSA